MTGTSIALMGIDGAGKSTLAGQIRSALTGRGLEVVDVTWRAAISSLSSGFPRDTLETLGREGWLLYYSGCMLDGQPVEKVLADTPLVEVAARMARATGPGRQSAVVTSGLVEMVGHYLLHAAVVEPALRRGAVTLSDGFGLKNVIKTLRLAQAMPGVEVPPEALERLVRHAVAIFADPYIQPDLGLLLDADPKLTARWRAAQTGGLSAAEDLTLAGQPGETGYVQLQSTLARELRDAADSWGWQVVTVDGRPQQETASQAVGLVVNHPTVRALTGS